MRTLAFASGFGVLATLAMLGYLIYLDRTIKSTFEGRRWSVPAQVFAQPTELFPGADLSRTALTRELVRLGYRRTTDLSQSGTYEVNGNQVEADKAYNKAKEHGFSVRLDQVGLTLQPSLA